MVSTRPHRSSSSQALAPSIMSMKSTSEVLASLSSSPDALIALVSQPEACEIVDKVKGMGGSAEAACRFLIGKAALRALRRGRVPSDPAKAGWAVVDATE